jgi:DNA-binding transcriptional LysR family regulator
MMMLADQQRTYHKRDRLRQLRAFCHAARLGSITQAAVHLGLSQPAVSLHVRELENELEAILFDRGGSGIRLTSAGETLYELAKHLVQGMDALSVKFMERIDDTVSGRLQLAASVAGASFILPAYIKRFRDQYPGVRLRVRSCLLSEGVKLLLDDEVEFVLGVKDPYPEDTLEYRQFLPYDIVLITSLDHPLAGRETVSPEEASAWPVIVPTPGTYSRQFGETAAQQFGVDVKAVIRVGGWEAIKRFVEQGLGISVVPSISVHETDQLSVIPLKDYFPTRSFGVLTRRGKFLTPPARRLLRLMIPDFPDPPPPPPQDR